MPVYEFLCQRCGLFEQRRSMDQATAPTSCPSCQDAAQRIFSAPGLRRTSDVQRKVMSRVEQGAEPSLERRPPPQVPTAAPATHAGHGRPWMLGH